MSEIKLTDEQLKIAEEYKNRYVEICISTTPADRSAFENAIKAAYKKYNEEQGKKVVSENPTFHWVDSPRQGAKKVIELLKTHPETASNSASLNVNSANDIKNQLSNANYGQFEAYWVSYYDFKNTVLDQKDLDKAEIARTICQNASLYWTFSENVVVSEKPIKLTLKNNKLHCKDGMALQFKDGSGFYCIDGQPQQSLVESILEQAYKEIGVN